jgi:F-type H+-transporting ATPase subunit c
MIIYLNLHITRQTLGFGWGALPAVKTHIRSGKAKTINNYNMLSSVLLQAAPASLTYGLAAIGAGIAALAAGVGIGRIGGSALESIARQPEAVNDIRASMILAAALVEGAAFFAMVIGLLVVLIK